MNDKQKVESKTVNDAIDQFEKAVVREIQKSNLPVKVVELVIRTILNEVSAQSRNIIEQERAGGDNK